MSDNLGDRMKRHESVSQNSLSIKTPVIIRVDGKSFHTFTKAFQRPFDETLSDAMINAAQRTAKHLQGFQLGFTASDEVSFYLSDFMNLESCPWFDYNVQKMVSITAAYMTAYFNDELDSESTNIAVFDARAFSIPKEDVPNYFVWRQKDWIKNSVSQYASAFFSHNQLQNKSTPDRHEMLHSIGKNWATDIQNTFKNGVYFSCNGSANSAVEPKYDAIQDIITKLVPVIE